MKKVFAIIAIVFFAGAMMTSCTPHKQACAAYSDVELPAAE